jgi:hypothetical protein
MFRILLGVVLAYFAACGACGFVSNRFPITHDWSTGLGAWGFAFVLFNCAWLYSAKG